MNSAKAKDFNFKNMQSQFGGYVSSVDKTNIAENLLVLGSQNVYKKLSGTYAVRQGQKRQGLANSTESACSSEFVWNTSWGAIRTMVVADSKLYTVIDETWYVLQESLTKTRYVFDNWWDNTEKKDRVLFVNGTDDMFHWSGGFATANAQIAGGSTLTKTGTTFWAQEGFSTTSGQKTFIINGSPTVYTYTGGEATTTLTGITPALPVITQDTAILQSVQTATDKPAAGFNSDFIKVINNQVYVGSYTSRLVYMSSDTDFTNYTVPSPQLSGSPGLFVLDGTVKGIGVRQGNACVGFGANGWAVISFELVSNNNMLTRNNKIDIKPVAVLQAPLAHEFIDSVGDNLIYLGQDHQVRSFGDFNNLFVAGYPSLSQEVATELAGVNFTGGGLRCIGEFIYITSPVTGKVYLRQERTKVDANGNVVAERLWHSPFIWNATFIDVIDTTVVAFSNANPQIYEVWDTGQWYDDSPSDEQLPYTSIMAFGYRGEQRRQGLWSFDKQYTEGYITTGTPLNLLMNYNYDGSTNQVNAIINNIEQPAYIFQTSPSSLGDSSLGDESLGEGGNADDSTTLSKFKVINSLPIINCFEWQPVYYSETANAQWEILALATNAEVELEQNPTFIINKNRN
jgi:hypothetical protein